jgi:hypothetical protein
MKNSISRLTALGLLSGFCLHQAALAAPWGPYPWAAKGPVVHVRAPLLVSPANDHRIPDNNGNDVSMTFSWQGQSFVRPRNDFPVWARPAPDAGYIRRNGPFMRGTESAPVAKRYEICVFDNVRCDMAQSGFQIFLPVGNATSRRLNLPSTMLQGRAFQWAVRECISYADHPALAMRNQSCIWSSANRISWDPAPLATPCSLQAYEDPRHLPNLTFEWCDVAGADRYLICMSASSGNLAQCTRDTNWQSGMFKDSSSDSDFRILIPPPHGAGSSGGNVYWKVSACQVSTQECSNWSNTASAQWP